MRAYRLAHVAVEAETIRWKCMATRLVWRIMCAFIAMLFLIGVIAFAHIAAWYWVRLGFDQNVYVAAGILGGADLVIAIGFGVLASRSSPGRQEEEALAVRRRAVQGMATAFSLAQIALPVLRMTGSLLRKARAPSG